MRIDASLGRHSLRNLLKINKDDIFVFNINDIKIQVSKNGACAISSKVSEWLACDQTINSWSVNLNYKDSEKFSISKAINEYFSILDKEKIIIDEENYNIFYSLAHQLKTDDVIEELDTFRLKLPLENETVFTQLIFKHENNQDVTEEIKYCSTHFLELIENPKMMNIIRCYDFSTDMIEWIVSTFFENIENHKKEIIERVISFLKVFYNDEVSSYIQVMNKVPSDKISKNEMLYYLKRASCGMDNNLGNSVIRKTLDWLTNSTVKKEESRDRIQTFEDQCNHLNGIFAHLRALHHGNPVHMKEVVSFAPREKETRALYNLLEYDEKLDKHYLNFFQKNGSRIPLETENFFQFDFLDKRVKITSYTLRTTANQLRPKSWRILGSIGELYHFDILDEQINNYDLNAANQVVRFTVNRPPKFVRIVRFEQIENHYQEDLSYRYGFELSAFEIFGDIDFGE